jgi:sulfite reductase beta subunit-like hemoprotein
MVTEIPVSDITRFIGRYTLGRDSNPLSTMESLHFLRIKVPGGCLTADQLRGIAALSDTYGRGRGEITNRQSIQLHWIESADALDIFAEMERLGFTTDMCGQGFSGARLGDARNIVCCPAAGVDPDELIDVHPLLSRLSAFFIGNPDFQDMPRKFKFALTGCQSDCTRAITNDLGIVAVEQDANVGFTFVAGGSMGSSLPGPRLATPLPIFVPPEDVFDVAVAVIEIHRDNSSRESKAKARFKWLLESWGVDRFLRVLTEKMGRTFDQYRGSAFKRQDAHLGVRQQKQASLYYVTVPLTTGRLSSRDMMALADSADEYGDGDLRLTPAQNVLIVGVRDRDALLTALDRAGFPSHRSELHGSSMGCASDYCGKTVSLHSKEVLATTIARLETRYDRDQLRDFRIHVSGCPHNCCANLISEIGLAGVLTQEADRLVQYYNLRLGGTYGPRPTLGRLAATRIPAKVVPETIEGFLDNFFKLRRDGERLTAFCQRQTPSELRGLVTRKV